MPIDPDDATDERLSAAFRAVDPPAPHDLAPRVRQLIRRRRTLARVGGVVAAAAVVAAGGIAWQAWPRTDDGPTIARKPDAPRVEREAPLPPALFAGPPVDSLGTLAYQQDAYLVALRQLVEE